MDFKKLIEHRYSCRSYQDRPVEEEKIQQILKAAQLAPTAANRQPFQLILIPTEGHQQKLRKIYNKEWFVQPPLVLCACGIPDQGWVRHKHDGENYTTVDVAIVVDHITLQAAELGLGTCWIGAFDPQAAREVLDLPADLVPIAFTPLGYPNDQPTAKSRKPVDELVRRHTWS